MQFQHVDRDQKGEFFLNNADGQRIAEISYIWRDETTIDANHTWVDDSLRGQGVARLLLDTLVDFSRLEEATPLVQHKFGFGFDPKVS